MQHNESEIQYLLNDIKKGRDYARLMRMIQDVSKNNPDNIEYKEALACSLIGRASSLLFAAYEWEDYGRISIQSFPGKKIEWVEAQNNPQSDRYKTPPPVEPYPVKTRDDGRLFFDTKETDQQVPLLITEANTILDEIVKSAKNPEQKAYYCWVRGWCHLIIKRFTSLYEYAKSKKQYTQARLSLLSTKIDDTIVADFEYSLSINKKKPEYWSALGDSLIPRGFISINNDFGMTSGNMLKCISAYEESIRNSKRNIDLLFWIFCLKYISGDTDLFLLKNLTRYYKDNSLFFYMYSALMYKKLKVEQKQSNIIPQKQIREIVNSIDEGNRIGIINIPTKKFDLPPYLLGLNKSLTIIQENMTVYGGMFSILSKIKNEVNPSDEDIVKYWLPMFLTIFDFPLANIGYFFHRCAVEDSFGILAKMDIDKLKIKKYENNMLPNIERKYDEIDSKRVRFYVLKWQGDFSRP